MHLAAQCHCVPVNSDVRSHMANPAWTSRGKSVAQLIDELRTFEDQSMEVRISMDQGATSLPISLVGRVEGKFAVLMNCEDEPTLIRHGS